MGGGRIWRGFDDSVQTVLELTEWLNDQGDDITPERLVNRLAEAYYHCDEGFNIEGDGPLNEKRELHDLSGEKGMTSALVCWLWCAGASITDIESVLGADDLSGLANTTSNLSSAVESIQLLYDPFEMPEEPEWLEMFADQIEVGVPGPDMYLVRNVDRLGRVLFNNLEDQLNITGEGADWDPGEDHFVIERLSKLLAERNDELFLEAMKATNRIGDTISENILDSVKTWNPNDSEMVEVPFAESARERHGSDELTQYYEANRESNTSDGTSVTGAQSTTLSDF